MRGGEEGYQRPTLRVSEQGRLGRTDRVEDRPEVVGSHVEVGRLLAVGEPGPALVEEDQAGE